MPVSWPEDLQVIYLLSGKSIFVEAEWAGPIQPVFMEPFALPSLPGLLLLGAVCEAAFLACFGILIVNEIGNMQEH